MLCSTCLLTSLLSAGGYQVVSTDNSNGPTTITFYEVYIYINVYL